MSTAAIPQSPIWAQCIVTHGNHLDDKGKGLYILGRTGATRIAIQLDQPAVDEPAWTPLQKRFIEGILNGEHVETAPPPVTLIKPFVFDGGSNDTSVIHVLHTVLPKHPNHKLESLFISYSTLDEVLGGESLPSLMKFFRGYFEISSADYQKNIEEGSWTECSCPAFIVFGKNGPPLARLSEGYPNEYANLSVGGMGTATAFAKLFMSYGTEKMLSAMRWTLFNHLRRTQRLPQNQIENIIEIYLAVQHHEGKSIFDLMISYFEEDILRIYNELGGRTLEFPIVKINRAIGKVCDLVGCDRYLYDFVICQAFIMNEANSDGTTINPSAFRDLELKMDQVADVVRAADRGDDAT